MAFIPAFELSASGLNAQRLRMDIASSNMANTKTTRGPDGKPYKKLIPVFETKALQFESTLDTELGYELKKVNIARMEESKLPPKKVYEPGHPDADSKGFVEYPNINLMEEMADMLLASRAYEANINAFNMSKTMAMSALELGSV